MNSRCPALVALVATVLAGRAAAAATTFVGPVAGAPASARVAVVVEDQKFVAYACAQDAGFIRTHGRWLTGPVAADGSFEATSPDGVAVKCKVQDKVATGTLTAKGGKALEFRAEALPAKAIAGLYRAEDTFRGEEFVLGWIVDRKHNVVGACAKKKNQALAKALAAKKQLPPPPPADDPPAEEEQAQAEEALVADEADEQAAAEGDEQAADQGAEQNANAAAAAAIAAKAKAKQIAQVRKAIQGQQVRSALKLPVGRRINLAQLNQQGKAKAKAGAKK